MSSGIIRISSGDLYLLLVWRLNAFRCNINLCSIGWKLNCTLLVGVLLTVTNLDWTESILNLVDISIEPQTEESKGNLLTLLDAPLSKAHWILDKIVLTLVKTYQGDKPVLEGPVCYSLTRENGTDKFVGTYRHGQFRIGNCDCQIISLGTYDDIRARLLKESSV